MAEVDLSEFVALNTRDQKQACKVGVVLEQLSEGDRAQVDAAFAAARDGRLKLVAIRRWLGKRGHDVNATSATSHRNNACSCANPRA